MLEPICVYLMIAQKQYEDAKFSGYYNVGPDERDCFRTGELVDAFCASWGEGLSWINKYDGGPHEANFLKLDCSKLKSVFSWSPTWSARDAVAKTVEWSKAWADGKNCLDIMDKQIEEFISLAKFINK